MITIINTVFKTLKINGVKNLTLKMFTPLRDEVLQLIEGSEPKLLERKKIGDRILKKIIDFVEKFINGMTGKYAFK